MKPKISKGKWKVCIQPSHGMRVSVRAYENNKSIEICSVNSPGFLENKSSKPVADAHAKLIVEAGNTYNATGLTPKELQENLMKEKMRTEGFKIIIAEYKEQNEKIREALEQNDTLIRNLIQEGSIAEEAIFPQEVLANNEIVLNPTK